MSGFQASAAAAAVAVYDLAFQVSPIIFVNGLAQGSLGNMLPVIGLTGQLASFVQGLVTNGLSLNDFFARYLPIPGGTFISQTIATYPFANQQVAGNAVIRQPLTLSMLMICPVNDSFGYATKLPLLTSLQQSFQQHNLLGGTYNIATPGMIYEGGVMIGMTHVDSGESKQVQIQFQLDFFFPLITQAQAAQAQGNLMQSATNGTQIAANPSWSGVGAAATNTFAGLPASIVPIIQNVLASP